MKAIVYTTYGSPDVLQFKEVEKPSPKDGEILVKVHAASVNALDWHLMRGKPFLVRIAGYGLRKPKDQRLGVDLAGRVEAVGSNVTQFQPGDEVFGRGLGAFAEYACAAENKVALKSANSSFEEAAAVPVAALTALQGLRDRGQIQPGQQVLIHGASGGVGTFAVQIAKAFGAEVTAVCSTRNVDLVRSIGADQVIDYTQEDFTRKGQHYDLILAVNGYHPIFAYKCALKVSFSTTGHPILSIPGGNACRSHLARFRRHLEIRLPVSGVLAVMLSAAKHLVAPRDRCFAALSMTPGVTGSAHQKQSCHAERSEASLSPTSQALRRVDPERNEGAQGAHDGGAGSTPHERFLPPVR